MSAPHTFATEDGVEPPQVHIDEWPGFVAVAGRTSDWRSGSTGARGVVTSQFGARRRGWHGVVVAERTASMYATVVCAVRGGDAASQARRTWAGLLI